MIKIPLMAIKGMTNSIAKVIGELGIKEEDKHSRRLEIPRCIKCTWPPKEPGVHLGNGTQRLQGNLQRCQGTYIKK